MHVSGSVTIANQPEVRVINTPDVNITNAPTLDARQAGDWSVSLVGAPFLEPGKTYIFSWIGSGRAVRYRVVELMRRDGWIRAAPDPDSGGRAVWLNPSAAAVIEEEN